MKYGDSLQQRSIPEWGPYNVDYNDIKHLIKVRTTRDQAQAISIPGRGNSEGKALKDFEDELYAELLEQHQRIDLFVQSKSGEIKRRLNHLQKQVVQLRQSSVASERTRISVKRVEKFARAEEDVLKAGGEIQSLSRFVGVQRLAFQKLLKKYKKWTGSLTLGRRFLKEVLDRPSSFSRKDFEFLLVQWTDVLATVRAPFEEGLDWKAGYGEHRPSLGTTTKRLQIQKPDVNTDVSSIASGAQLQAATDTGSEVDLDTALATTPLGHAGGKAVYWVHPDNLVQIQVLLLQHTRLRTGQARSPRSSTMRALAPQSSHEGSPDITRNHSTEEKDDEIGLLILDNLERFAKGQSSATISDVEDTVGEAFEKTAATVRWCAGGEAVIVVGTSPRARSSGSERISRRNIQQARLKPKNLQALLDLDRPLLLPRRESEPSHEGTEETTTTLDCLENVRNWLSRHKDVKPLVQIHCRRTRFVGLSNNSTRGVWVTLDKDIKMNAASLDRLGVTEGAEMLGEKSSFPYAVLQVRWEGDPGTHLARALDQSHLTERVRGFSIDTHAIATLCHPSNMLSPYWLPALQNDIRKVPKPKIDPPRRGSSTQPSPASANTHNTSTSATSITDGLMSGSTTAAAVNSSATSIPEMLESPPLSAFKKKRRNLREHPLRKGADEMPRQYHQRYWNEFDDGDEASDHEAYTIFVDPNARSTFPGKQAVTRIGHWMSKSASSTSSKMKALLKSIRLKGERKPIVADYIRQQHQVNGSDLEDEALFNHQHNQSRRDYSTFPDGQDGILTMHRGDLLFRSSIGCFFAAIILILISAILATDGRRKKRVSVNLGVVVGVVASLVFAVLGVGMVIIKKERLGWPHRIIVLLTFGLICIASGILLALVGSNV
ncbi:MAG: hypothetical protein M1827_005343 [Pycnora praestabilis]|nr:MAG: hypothetical protein M1827_005343 [Pycnora praestabilis]